MRRGLCSARPQLDRYGHAGELAAGRVLRIFVEARDGEELLDEGENVVDDGEGGVLAARRRVSLGDMEGGSLSSGVYLYRLKASEFVDTRRSMWLKWAWRRSTGYDIFRLSGSVQPEHGH